MKMILLGMQLIALATFLYALALILPQMIVEWHKR